MQHSHQGKLPRMRRPYCGGGSWFGDFSSLVFLCCLVFARINYYFANRESQTPKLNTCAYHKKICYLEQNSRYFEAGKSLAEAFPPFRQRTLLDYPPDELKYPNQYFFYRLLYVQVLNPFFRTPLLHRFLTLTIHK